MSPKFQGLSGKSRTILEYIAQGYSYQRILETNSDFTYIDIFKAAEEALDAIDSKANLKVEEAKTHNLDMIRKQYPRAYEKWSPEEDTKLVELFKSGISNAEISSTLQRQESAIRSRLGKLGLIEQ